MKKKAEKGCSPKPKPYILKERTENNLRYFILMSSGRQERNCQQNLTVTIGSASSANCKSNKKPKCSWRWTCGLTSTVNWASPTNAPALVFQHSTSEIRESCNQIATILTWPYCRIIIEYFWRNIDKYLIPQSVFPYLQTRKMFVGVLLLTEVPVC